MNVGTGITANTINCIDPKTNGSFCGATGNASGAATAEQKGTACAAGYACVNGTCVINSCSGDKPNLCVVNNTNTCVKLNGNTASHCGACNYSCSAHPITNATSNSCSGGNCQYTCKTEGNVTYVNVGTGITANTINCIDPKTNGSFCGATGNATGAASSEQKGDVCVKGKVNKAFCDNGTCYVVSCNDNYLVNDDNTSCVQCTESNIDNCNGYQCNNNECRTQCSKDEHCATGYFCKNKKCSNNQDP